MTDDLLTIDEAAAALRMSKASFRRRLDDGEFTIIRDRRTVLVPRSALVDYLRRHTLPARSARPEARRVPRVRPLWERAE